MVWADYVKQTSSTIFDCIRSRCCAQKEMTYDACFYCRCWLRCCFDEWRCVCMYGLRWCFVIFGNIVLPVCTHWTALIRRPTNFPHYFNAFTLTMGHWNCLRTQANDRYLLIRYFLLRKRCTLNDHLLFLSLMIWDEETTTIKPTVQLFLFCEMSSERTEHNWVHLSLSCQKAVTLY